MERQSKRTASARRRWIHAAKADFRWFLVMFVAANLTLVLVTDLCVPRAFDQEYGTRLGLLQDRRRENPDRPLLLMLGSSMTGQGFHPENMAPLITAEGKQALAFNFSHLANGPITNLAHLRRLLSANILPNWLVLEINPVCLHHEGHAIATTNCSLVDLPVLLRHFPDSKVWTIFLRGRLNPWYKHRQILLEQAVPCLACPRQAGDTIQLDPLGGDSYWFARRSLSKEDVLARTDRSLAFLKERFEHFRVAPSGDEATRATLELCRQKGIQVVVLIPPLDSRHRTAFSSESSQIFSEYLSSLTNEFDVPVVDARNWLADDAFYDGTHLLRHGGDIYTQHLEREVMRPLVAGQFENK